CRQFPNSTRKTLSVVPTLTCTSRSMTRIALCSLLNGLNTSITTHRNDSGFDFFLRSVADRYSLKARLPVRIFPRNIQYIRTHNAGYDRESFQLIVGRIGRLSIDPCLVS